MPATATKPSPQARTKLLFDATNGRKRTEQDILDGLRKKLEPDASGNKMSQSELAACVGVHSANISRLLKNTINERTGEPFKPSRQFLLQAAAYLDSCEMRELDAIEFGSSASSIQFVETSVSRNIWRVCDFARADYTIAMISSETSMGKTVAIKEYCKKNPAAIYIHASPWTNTQFQIMHAIWSALGFRGKKQYSAYQRCAEVVKSLTTPGATSRIIIIDDAHFLRYEVFETLRSLHDDTETADHLGVPIVLAGTTRLDSIVSVSGDSHQLYEQIRARVGLHKIIGKPSREDVQIIAGACAPAGATFDAKAREFLYAEALGLGAFRRVRQIVSKLHRLGGKDKIDFKRPITQDDLAKAATLIGRRF